jgi:uncharacterized protein (DUF2384 family)
VDSDASLERALLCLRQLFDSDAALHAWLEQPHELLDGHSPAFLISQGQSQEVAEFIHDLCTGQPT